MKIKKSFVTMMLIVLPMAGCSCGSDGDEVDDAQKASQMASEKEAFDTMVNEGRSENERIMAKEPSACDTFEAHAYDDAVVESKYAVCVNADSGDCYIKTFYPVPKQGCDLQFGTYRNGNPACFNWVNNIHAMTGETVVESQTDYRAGDSCEFTNEAYFRSKVEKK